MKARVQRRPSSSSTRSRRPVTPRSGDRSGAGRGVGAVVREIPGDDGRVEDRPDARRRQHSSIQRCSLCSARSAWPSWPQRRAFPPAYSMSIPVSVKRRSGARAPGCRRHPLHGRPRSDASPWLCQRDQLSGSCTSAGGRVPRRPRPTQRTSRRPPIRSFSRATRQGEHYVRLATLRRATHPGSPSRAATRPRPPKDWVTRSIPRHGEEDDLDRPALSLDPRRARGPDSPALPGAVPRCRSFTNRPGVPAGRH